MKKMLLAAMALCASVALAEGTFALKCGVSVPAEARESEAFAAKEWSDWSSQVTGWTCAVVPEKDAGVVLRRDDTLGEDAFRLKVEGGRLVVSGGRRGILYGVYEALERFAGVRWFSQNTTVVPKAKAIEVPAALDEVQRPAFELREPQFAELRRNPDLAARLKLNGPQLESRHGGCSHRFDKVLKHCHTMEDLVPYDKYFKDHPEYFAEIDGKRVGFCAQPCLTNPDVLRIVVQGVLARMRANPEVRLFGVSQNDNELYCRCAKCAAVDAEEGSHAGTMIRFVNAVAAETSKEFPQNVISTLAYLYTRKPPKVTKARPDVMPVICSIECEYSAPISAAANEASRTFLADLEGWARMTDRIYIWDYVANFANMTYPFRNTYVLQDNIRLFARNKVKYLYEQGTARYRHAEFSELKAYLISKWMWNPELPIEPMLEEFFAAYYGKAAPAVRRYFDEEHSLPSDPERSPMWIYEDATSSRVTDEFLERAARIWDEAEALAAGDPHAGYNVRTSRLSVDIPRLMRHRNARENWGALQALAKKTLATIAETGDDVNLDEKAWTKPIYRADWRKMATMTYEEATADLTASVVPRSEAIVSIDRVLWEPGRLYTLQARVNGGHFRTAVGVRDSNTIRRKTEIGEPKGEGYQWYDVMTGYFQPGQFMSFYSGSPKVTMEAFRLVPVDR